MFTFVSDDRFVASLENILEKNGRLAEIADTQLPL